MGKIIVIGGGISGLSIAQMLHPENDVTIFEADGRPGGMIKCDVIDGNLYHRTGGHVFNTKRPDVLEWFWSFFDKEKEFVKTLRNSSVAMGEKEMIPYPVENHVYCLPENIKKAFINDVMAMIKSGGRPSRNFEEFLRGRFGETLYNLYFQPYNYKVWRRDLTTVPLSWLEGKLPMPTIEEILYNNIEHVEEREFVHSSFYYPKNGGSQFIADRLAKGVNIIYNSPVERITRNNGKWIVRGIEADILIFCGNIKFLPSLLDGEIDMSAYNSDIEGLESHGTTSVFCEVENNPYSWIYLPDRDYEAHRIICTGNFSSSNNAKGKMTGTVEFTDFISRDDLEDNLLKMPFSLRYLAHHYEKYTYPIQNEKTRDMLHSLRMVLKKENVFLLGRFAEWEYYNMDVAIGAAIDLARSLY